MEFRIDADFTNAHGEYDDTLARQFNAELLERFVDSEEYQRLDCDSLWTDPVLGYAADYLGVSVSEMSVGDLNEVLFELFPRKVSCDSESAAEIIAEQRAFWTWLDREFHLANAPQCLKALGGDAVAELEDALSDSDNFGMAKSFFMMGKELGFEMNTPEGLQAFTLVYNAALRDQNVGRSAVPPHELDAFASFPQPLPQSHGPRDWHAKVARSPEQRRRDHAKQKKQAKRQRQLKMQKSQRPKV